jgi:hypothetical protein
MIRTVMICLLPVATLRRLHPLARFWAAAESCL